MKWNATFPIQHNAIQHDKTCSGHSTKCTVHSAEFRVHGVQLTVHRTLCTLYKAHCRVEGAWGRCECECDYITFQRAVSSLYWTTPFILSHYIFIYFLIPIAMLAPIEELPFPSDLSLCLICFNQNSLSRVMIYSNYQIPEKLIPQIQSSPCAWPFTC